MKKARCKICKYYDKSESTIGHCQAWDGYCLRYPGAINVYADGWCGEWVHKDESDACVVNDTNKYDRGFEQGFKDCLCEFGLPKKGLSRVVEVESSTVSITDGNNKRHWINVYCGPVLIKMKVDK